MIRSFFITGYRTPYEMISGPTKKDRSCPILCNRLFCSENTVARIAQTGYDVTVLVEAIV